MFHKTCRIEIDAWRSRAIAAETTVHLLTEILQRERESRARLEDKLTPKLAEHSGPPELKPVGQSVSSWPRIRRELEKQHKVNENAEVSRAEIEKTLWSQK
jgi:serine/threonine protein kinase HipA of HipAB toxin-antitoxin module